MRQPSSSTESSTSAPLSTTTPCPSTVLNTAPPRMIAPSETSELSAWPACPAASATTFAGPRPLATGRSGQATLYRSSAGRGVQLPQVELEDVVRGEHDDRLRAVMAHQLCGAGQRPY